MATPTIKSLLELVDERPDEDRSGTYAGLWQIMVDLKEKIGERLTLTPDPSTADLQPYEVPTGGKGFLSTFTGPELDWLVHSWIGNPEQSFSNMHLSCWLGAQTRVPHLGMAFGTMPDVFMYVDYIPRVDIWMDLDYHDKYYEPVNEAYIELRGNPNLSPFVSKSLYMRTAQTQTSACFMAPANEETLVLARNYATEMVDRWLDWIEAGDPVPEDEQAALAERDLFLRRTIAERDPANVMGVRMFGEEFTDRLVRALWGGDRELPRPHER